MCAYSVFESCAIGKRDGAAGAPVMKLVFLSFFLALSWAVLATTRPTSTADSF